MKRWWKQWTKQRRTWVRHLALRQEEKDGKRSIECGSLVSRNWKAIGKKEDWPQRTIPVGTRWRLTWLTCVLRSSAFFFFFFKWRHRTCLEVRLMRNCGLTWEMRSLLTMSTQPCTLEGLLVSSSARWCLYDLRWKLAPKTKPHFSYLFTCSVYRWHFNKIF